MKSLLIAVSLMCVSAGAQVVDFDLKGIELGMPMADVRAALPGIDAHCKRAGAPGAVTACMYLGPGERDAGWNYKVIPALDTFAGGDVRYVDIQLRDDAVVRVAIKFPASGYDLARTALAEKYGPPAQENKNTALWKIGDRILGASRHAGSLLWSGVTLSTGAEIARDKKDRTSRATKDL